MDQRLAAAVLSAVAARGPVTVAGLADGRDERPDRVAAAVGALAARDLVATEAAGVVATRRGERRLARLRHGEADSVLEDSGRSVPIEANAGP